MTRTRYAPVAALALMGLLIGTARTSVAKEEPSKTSVFRDKALIEKTLQEACDAVEAECGVKFEKRPTIAISDTDTVRQILLREFKEIPVSIIPESGREAFAKVMAKHIIGKYDIENHVLHLLPDNLDKMLETFPHLPAVGLAELRVLVAHEATHAMDFNRFPLQKFRRETTDASAFRCINAVVEGHAEWVSKRIADTWGVPKAHANLLALMHAEDPENDEIVRAVLGVFRAELLFAYERGCEFFEAVFAAKGREGVLKVMQTPPTDVRHIEQPKTFLTPDAHKKTIDTKSRLEPFRPLVSDDIWTRNEVQLLKLQLMAMEQMIPESHRKNFGAGFVDGFVLLGMQPVGRHQVTIVAINFDSEEHATAFTEASLAKVRAADTLNYPGIEIKTLATTDGAGPGNTLPGMWLSRQVILNDDTMNLELQIFQVGTMSYEITFMNVPEYDRTVQDAFVAYALARDEVRSSMTPPVVPVRRRKISIAATGPDGAPIAKAEFVYMNATRERHHGVIVDGSGEVIVESDPGVLAIYNATDKLDAPLSVGPRQVAVSAKSKDVAIQLPEATPFAGVVRDENGEPVPGVRLKAKTNWISEARMPMALEHGKVTTDAAGRFEFTSLGPFGYDVNMYKDDAVRAADPIRVDLSKTMDRTRDIQLVRTTTYTITALLPNGQPLQFAHVQVHSFGNSRMRIRSKTDVMGVAKIEGLIDVPCELKITPNEKDPDVAVWLKRNWTQQNETISLLPGWSLKGTLVDANDKPIQGRVVDKRGSTSVTRSTGPLGTFTIGHLSFGSPAYLAGMLPKASDDKSWRTPKTKPFAQTDKPIRLVVTRQTGKKLSEPLEGTVEETEEVKEEDIVLEDDG